MAAPDGRAWLDVPFGERSEAKARGARWDPQARRWYAPRPGLPAMDRWAARPDLPDVLPGEDRTYGNGLFVDLIPSSSWWTNVRSAVAPTDWDRLRRTVYRRADYRCEACGAAQDPARGIRMEAHERFTYDAAAGIQRLVRLVCFCQWCHAATHLGMAGIRGIQDEAVTHLMVVTGMDPAQANDHIDEAFARWERRSDIPWRVDLSMIAAAGIRLSEPPRPAPQMTELDEDGVIDLLVVTTTTLVASAVPAAKPEPGPAGQALAATYKRYAGELAAIEALRSGRPKPDQPPATTS